MNIEEAKYYFEDLTGKDFNVARFYDLIIFSSRFNLTKINVIYDKWRGFHVGVSKMIAPFPYIRFFDDKDFQKISSLMSKDRSLLNLIERSMSDHELTYSSSNTHNDSIVLDALNLQTDCLVFDIMNPDILLNVDLYGILFAVEKLINQRALANMSLGARLTIYSGDLFLRFAYSAVIEVSNKELTYESLQEHNPFLIKDK